MSLDAHLSHIHDVTLLADNAGVYHSDLIVLVAPIVAALHMLKLEQLSIQRQQMASELRTATLGHQVAESDPSCRVGDI